MQDSAHLCGHFSDACTVITIGISRRVILDLVPSLHLCTNHKVEHSQWRTDGGVWGVQTPRNSEVLTKLHLIEN